MKPHLTFDNLSPIDYRYWDEKLAEYFSEEAFVRYKLAVEESLVEWLAKEGICPEEIVKEVRAACCEITAEEVYAEEEKIHHDVRALVNCICRRISDKAKPFVHLLATSYDIVDTANAARYRDAVLSVLVPALVELEKVLIEIALREAETVQIGRTHGQHALPVTFGFVMAGYVSRLGSCIMSIKKLAKGLRGKFSGAVGAYNASSFLLENPEAFEVGVLAKFDLAAAEISTQIVPPEAMTRLFCEIAMAMGVLANLADDMRNLQRTEIGEVGEEFAAEQVGSSTMPQKRNPINFENAKSCWKIVMPRMMTIFMDQISEHQRDLTNSASARTYGEIIAYVVSSARRLAKTMKKLKVDRANLKRNLAMQGDLIVSEAFYVVLASLGCVDAHEKIKILTLKAQKKGCSLWQAVKADAELQTYLAKMTDGQPQAFFEPAAYTGIAAKKARDVAKKWKKRLKI